MQESSFPLALATEKPEISDELVQLHHDWRKLWPNEVGCVDRDISCFRSENSDT